jgi:hypothetical protein
MKHGRSTDLVKWPDKGASNLNRHSLIILRCALSRHLRIISGFFPPHLRAAPENFGQALASRSQDGVLVIAHAASYGLCGAPV